MVGICVISSRRTGVTDRLQGLEPDEALAPFVGICDGGARLDAGITIALVDTEAEAETAVRDGAHDALVWPSEAHRLVRAVLSARTAARREIDLVRYRTVFRQTAIWQELGDPDIVLLDVSDGFEAATAHTREAVVGRTPRELFRGGTHSRAFYDELTAQVERTGRWRGDMLGRRRDGSLGVLDTQIGLIRHGERTVGQYAIKREAGANRNGALQTWIDERASAQWVLVQVGGGVLEASSHVQEALGVGRDELLGRDPSVVGLTLDMPAPGGHIVGDQWLGERAFQVDVQRRLVGDMDVLHVVLLDVTTRKLEAEKLDLLAQDLAAARDQALAADRSKSAFLAAMSHELRTPLNAILGYTELLAEDAEGQTLADLDRVAVSGRHLLGLVDEILDLARIEAGAVHCELERVDARSLLEDVASTLALRVRRAGQRIEIDCDDHPVLADPQRLRQILTNLVGNATKYAVPGRILVGCRAGRVFVEDEGPGIALHQQEAIFEPFRRLHQGGVGVGLGLAVSRRLARALGTQLVVQSAPGTGSRFDLQLTIEGFEAESRAG
ncbi:MAG: HAMP domain-containing histidine kinase [Alphaproteobacteria bacterium]|nr:HAMP domain-containing histidine kinase [Alphaproteobacteria bacterium]